MEVDAVVSTPTTDLLDGRRVDEAIHRAAGPELLAECQQLGGCARGQAKITKAYRLPNKYVIHTVGPVWNAESGGEWDVLASCYRSSLGLALEYHCETIAFPLISPGGYNYPKNRALRIATEAICDFLDDHDMTVYLVLFDRETFKIGQGLFDSIDAYIDQQYVENCTDGTVRQSRWYSYRDSTTQIIDFDDAFPRSPAEIAMAAPPPAPESAPPPKPDASSRRKKGFLWGRTKKEKSAPETSAVPSVVSYPNLTDALRMIDEGFSESLLRLIDQRGMTDAQCYKKANIDRRLFSKIRNNPTYRPSKATALAFAVALELSLSETEEFLRKAGFALSKSSEFDIIVEYFISRKCYDVFMINEALLAFDQSLLGG